MNATNKKDNIGNIAWKSGSKMIMESIKPIFKNLKEEVLNNKFASISKRCWNDTLRKCQAIYKGQVQSTVKKQWSQQLKENNIGMKELIALKLYCDFDDLQREFRKCFRSPYNENNDRLSSFYFWNKTLSKTFAKFSDLKYTKKYNVLFHGISSVMNINNFAGKCFGPLSTTTDISVARSFAGKDGMILVIEPKYNEKNGYKPVDISNLSEFPDEHEILCFDQSYCIKNVILSSEFDANFQVYDVTYSPKSKSTEYAEIYDNEMDEDDIELVSEQCENIKYLHGLSESIMNKNGRIEIKDIIQFLFQFISSYINNDPHSKFDSFINSNIKYITKDINNVCISSKLLNEIIKNPSCSRCNINQIKDAFIQYFATINVQFI